MNLTYRLKNLIRQKGFLNIAELMEEALYNMDYGYYTNTIPIGASGDFTTSPEISQLFGEMIGLWCADCWYKNGWENINLVELGPGLGTLMRDLLMATRNIPNFHNSLVVHMVEISPRLRELQQKKLLAAFPNISFTWHEHYLAIPSNRPLLIVANEFFDAMPIIQYYRGKDDWYEQVVMLSEDETMFYFNKIPVDKSLNELLQEENPTAKYGDILEVSPASIKVMQHIAELIEHNGGGAVIIDYGYDFINERKRGYGSTLQAVKNHTFHQVLDNLGQADLTAHVDFKALREAAEVRGLKVSNTFTQADFLRGLGIEIRAKILADKNPEHAMQIRAGMERLIDPKQMGEIFKVILIS
jgi:NADH dehydrogenase [ubiquinone] 1 alpha subcomplex assembly factor 7